MTKEEAQQAWKKMRSEIYETNWLFVGTINPQMVDMAIEALSSEAVQDWITVSEGLPEDREDVLVYLSSARIAIANYNKHKLPFNNTVMGWGYCTLNGHIDFGKEGVIAWMPLPEPYTGEMVDQNRMSELYIKVRVKDDPGTKAEKLYQICEPEELEEVAKYLDEYIS